jgi:adsorption protein B
VPVGRSETGQLVVAVGGPLDKSEVALLETALGHHPIQRIARESEIARGLRLLAGRHETGDPWSESIPLLGDILLTQGLVDPARLRAALRDYQPSRDGQLGDFLVTQGVLTSDALTQGLAAQKQRAPQRSPAPGVGTE